MKEKECNGKIVLPKIVQCTKTRSESEILFFGCWYCGCICKNSEGKIVIVNGTKMPWRNEEGFVIMGIKYFLLNADSLEF